MELLKFYISTIFSFDFITPTEACAKSEQIQSYCYWLLFSLNIDIAFGFLICLAPIFFKKFKLSAKLFLFYISAIFCAFITYDFILKQLSDVSNFGRDAFITSFYLWCYFAVILFYAILIFEQELAKARNKILAVFCLVTLILTISFAFTGRGTIEHITPILGGLLAKFSLSFLWLSFIFKTTCANILLWVLFTLSKFIFTWVVTAKFDSSKISPKPSFLICYILVLLLPAASIPAGEYLNKKDLKHAETYIDGLIKKVTKYKLENGEYPKLVTIFFDVDKNYPKLLLRHDYLSYGTKGAYYFSRADKYCFVFQNPARKLGYYSITSNRTEWKFFSYKGSLDEEYINVCDEQFSGSDNVVGGSLGLTDPYSEIEEMAAQLGAQTQKPAISLKANEVLKDVLDEYGKKDPSIYQNNQPFEQKR